MIIDTHSHLNFKAYNNDREEVIKRAQKEGIVCIDVGTKYETSKQAIELAEKYNKGVYAAIGLHPIYASAGFQKLKTGPDEGEFLIKEESFDKEKYKELAKSKKVVAIGEIGLDYYYKPKSKTKLEQFKEMQKKVFVEQLELAEELNLPVIMHCRMAHQDLINILKNRKHIKGVIHCFTGTLNEAQQYIDLGFCIGINGIIFKFNVDEVIKTIPLEKILTETDCPYLTPPIEGKDKRNEPIFIKHVVQKIADLRQITFGEVADKTTKNAKKLFKI
jgi:TatD DNase family protein